MGALLGLGAGIGTAIASIVGTSVSLVGGLSVCLGAAPMLLLLGGLAGVSFAAAVADYYQVRPCLTEVEIDGNWVEL